MEFIYLIAAITLVTANLTCRCLNIKPSCKWGIFFLAITNAIENCVEMMV